MAGATLLHVGLQDLVLPSNLGPAQPPKFDSNKFTGSGTPATGLITTAAGELIVVLSGTEDTATTLSAPTGNGVSFTQRSVGTAANNAWGGVFTGVDAAGGANWTLSQARSATVKRFGWAAFVFPAGSTVGHSPTGKAVNGAATIDVVTTQPNSSIVAAIFDWNIQAVAVNWASINGFTPNEVNQGEKARVIISGAYNIYVAYYPDVGPAGTKTITGGGLTFNNVMIAQEIIKVPDAPAGSFFEGWGAPI